MPIRQTSRAVFLAVALVTVTATSGTSAPDCSARPTAACAYERAREEAPVATQEHPELILALIRAARAVGDTKAADDLHGRAIQAFEAFGDSEGTMRAHLARSDLDAAEKAVASAWSDLNKVRRLTELATWAVDHDMPARADALFARADTLLRDAPLDGERLLLAVRDLARAYAGAGRYDAADRLTAWYVDDRLEERLAWRPEVVDMLAAARNYDRARYFSSQTYRTHYVDAAVLLAARAYDNGDVGIAEDFFEWGASRYREDRKFEMAVLVVQAYLARSRTLPLAEGGIQHINKAFAILEEADPGRPDPERDPQLMADALRACVLEMARRLGPRLAMKISARAKPDDRPALRADLVAAAARARAYDDAIELFEAAGSIADPAARARAFAEIARHI